MTHKKATQVLDDDKHFKAKTLKWDKFILILIKNLVLHLVLIQRNIIY